MTSLGLVVQGRERHSLIDVGPYAVQGLKNLGLTPDDIGLIFASHDHADHCGGVPAFIMTWLLGSASRPEKVDWAVPHERLAMLDYARSGYPILFAGSGPRRIDVVTSDVTLGETSYEWLKLEHAVETWGARVTQGPVSLAYIPDTAAAGLAPHQSRLTGIDAVVLSVWGPSSKAEDAQRFKFPVASEVGELAAQWGVKRIFVQHLADPSDYHMVQREIASSFDGEVIFPEVGEWIDLS
ncbi:MBL fold metallo-hydrolase [Actinoplanes sp. GCM10030250]|uniref:MBL fold metallo-hydrolase n=1 Tax=Actinoplanes sp. GCM10030250 TaxID=3273376 RepID=UPI00360FE713